MGKELQILAIVGSIIFGIWYLNKEGCKGDSSSGITGPEGSLCWSGESLSEMFGGAGGSEDLPPPEDGASIVDQAAGLDPNEPAGSPAEADELTRLAGNKAAADWRKKYPGGIHPASRLAEAFASSIEDQITIA